MSPDDLFADGGSTGRLMTRLDWAGTPLGPPAEWSQSLRAAVRIVLSSRYPMLLLWGPQYTQLYNDAYSALIGDKHPAAMGGDVRITLAEGWDVLQPLIADVMATGVASWVPALQLLLDRSGYREEAYFSVSHAPARDDLGRTVGVLTVCSEVTHQVVGERRLRLLRDLTLYDDSHPVDVPQTCSRLATTIGEHPLDVPFAGIYLWEGNQLRRAAVAGAGAHLLPEVLPAGGPARAAGDPWAPAATVTTGATRFDVPAQLAVPAGPWADPVRDAIALPLPSADRRQPDGVLVAGVSPNRGLDEGYRSFFDLLAQQVAAAVRNAEAHQQERRRAEALAELDRAKTTFFTNVSHEFRTPLTLMLGPLADALGDRDEPLGAAQRERVDTAWRNATRLLTLVNNLMTFSALEAGRAGNAPREVDLARLTRDLAGVFRAAVERAAVRLVVDCPPLPRPTMVDAANWEKIVTNLISNALKFTFVGEIRVTLESGDDEVRLRVADTGIGIAETDLPHLFDRFHRVHGARSRSHEGTGIGLALVRELARLLGGDVRVVSAPGEGSTFTVALPWAAVEPSGAAPDVPDAAVPGEAARAAAQEVLGWLDDVTSPVPEPVDAPAARPAARILVADDNSDMRAYLSRLLTAQAWEVEAVADGQAALEAIRLRPPDLLLTDVMMPRLDGFRLVRMLRQDEATRALPIVMLSARAGREAGVEGLEAGADDYVVKPFTAAELIARVRTTLRLSRLRGTHTRQPSAPAGTAEVIAAGRALQDTFQAATEQARALLGGVRAVTVLAGDGGRAPLAFSTPAPAGKADEPGGRDVVAAIPGRQAAALGTITVNLAGGRPPPDDAPALLSPIAHMLGALAESSWQLEHERQVAHTLQRTLLPEKLPEAPGWELAAGYLPAGDIGGDWYDAVALPGGDLLLSIGDVAGHGLDAAVITGQIRNAVRAYARADATPARILSRLGTLLGARDTPLFATLLLVRLEPGTGALTWCTAGHPVPVRCTPGGPGDRLTGAVGPPLGLARAGYRDNRAVLDPGTRLLLFTDGLVEDRDRSLDDGLRRLIGRCEDLVRANGAVRDVVDGVLAGAPQPPPDDIAVLAVQRLVAAPAPTVAAVPDLAKRWVYPLVPTAASAMRRDVRAVLDRDIDPDLLDDLQLAATEAVNNAVEHAQHPTRPEVEVGLRIAGGIIRVTVRDFGRWRGREAAMDRGRGALLMNAYGEVRITSSEAGTVVTIERNLAPGPDIG